ncbi:putative glycine dehydrogenase (decarboxylating) subunit 1 [Vulcanimicrobium alpinum]|uniref:Glycine dehydrogenase (Decarboxylating) subunit 1 n=1 Tax=Vulcanimicrobium alpinum TaxID=3016050 RepID=A0AAN1XUQ2_UNVUL|nr:aminomethyl-transferring glycine dehydrogenase subunit GcvPA [Vulcanimicrobium alpinum]BDE05350.1 putative glycine dehydrogenase (decarboxylating) subunit 1 [Vulcanimicrobium alpinum]
MYTPHTPADIEAMLAAIGVASLDDLVRVPDALALRAPVEVTPQLSEIEIADRFRGFAERTTAPHYTSFLGAGAYRHYIPPVVGALAMRGEFLTSYTPYQAEVSQGYLQAIYEWQTYIALLTGLDVANASVYDGATALAEGVIMAVNATGRKAVLVSAAVHPNYRAVLRTYADGLDLTVDELPYASDGRTDLGSLDAALADQRYAAVVVQSPNVFGAIDALPAGVAAKIKTTKTVVIGVVAEAMSLAALATPSSWGVEICVGEGQSFGNAIAYGGPHVGFIAATSEHLRRIPGRLVGKSVDVEGRPAYVLTLQAREQHIRREKATSNICTNQAHCALCATIYLAAMGKTGLRDCAALNVARTQELRERVTALDGFSARFDAPTFNEFALRVPGRAAGVLAALEARQILGGLDLGRFYPELDDCILMTATELTSSADIDRLVTALSEIPARAAARV